MILQILFRFIVMVLVSTNIVWIWYQDTKWKRLWSHDSWIYNYLCNQCLTMWVRIPLMVRCTWHNFLR